MIIGPTTDARSLEISTIDRSSPRLLTEVNSATMLGPAGLVGPKPIPIPITKMQITAHMELKIKEAAKVETAKNK